MGRRGQNRAASWIVGFVAAAAIGAPLAQAQPPDARAIRPLVMLLVDTSGSMELLPNCVCRTPSCQECFPMCRETPGDQRNRWATVLEALTGQWSEFRCRKEDRARYPKTEYDYLYPVPHFRNVSPVAQISNGVLDAYIDRARFGLMTFDGQPTFFGASELVPARRFRARLRDSRRGPGMFSYGEPKPFTFPGCGEQFMVDNGARNEEAPVGRLISVGRESDDFVRINQEIQRELLRVRPYGGTPIAGMLDDLGYYFENHPDVREPDDDDGDPFYACRPRYAVLLTDGTPSGEMREYGCETPGFRCPYEKSWDIAMRLCDFSPGAGCRGVLDGLFVVGFDIRDPAARSLLDEIANSGGTGRALFADDRASLVARLGEAIDRAAPQASTRTRPAFVNASYAEDTKGAQMQFNTGFRVPLERGGSWEGVLERRRYECNAALEPEPQPLDPTQDLFHETLNRQTRSPIASTFSACPAGKPRCLLTALPSDPASVSEALAGDGCFRGEGGTLACYGPVTFPGGSALPGTGPGGAEPACGVTGSTGTGGTALPSERGLSLVGVDEAMPESYLGPGADRALRDEVVAWLHGLPGSGRESKRLGDIYHSSPVVVGPPQRDLPDESYNLFRRRPDVKNRPHVLYVGTNDGILHAFVADDVTITEGPHRGTRLKAGQELWGFVPPVLLPKVPSALDSHQIMVDGTPVVRDVFLRRLPGQTPDGDMYRTVLVVGLRRGGAAYVALDVTDPLAPKFLWQFTDPEMGDTLGRPALAQVLLETADGLEERAVAILPGGEGEDISGRCGRGDDGERGCKPMGFGLVPPPEGSSEQRRFFGCWGNRGRRLFVVDVATGQRLAVFDDRTFNSPLTGGVAVFPGEPGTIATRAFVTDRDGVIWRLDLSSPKPSEWKVTPFHDLFYDGEDARASQPALEPPLVSVDKQGRIVVLQGSSDVDRLDEIDVHRVASLLEVLDFAPDGRVRESRTRLNWEITLKNEQLTGPIELFNGVAYFATFRGSRDEDDACKLGESRIWGVEYLRAEAGSTLPRPALPVAGSPDRRTRWIGPYENEIVMGVSVTQRPSCVTITDASVTDPYVGTRSYQRVTGRGGGQFQLVALAGGSGPRSGGAAVREIVVPDIAQPISYTRVEGYAGTVE